MKDKRGIISFIIIILIFVLGVSRFNFSIFPNNNDYARITNMDYKAVVVDEPDSEGKIVVTERITFDVHAASRDNGFWELWRDLCENYVDGVKVHYKVNSVKQIMSDGTEIVWKESPKLYWNDSDYVSGNAEYGPGKWYHSEGPYNESARRYECLLFYVDNLYREEIVFEIEYEMYNAVLRYNDCSDLYIAMYSGDTTKYLKSFNAEILIPNKDMPKKGNYSFTTYGTNANSFPVQESASKNPGYYTFSFNLTKDDLKFKQYNEYIEFDLISFGEDKHIFAEFAPNNLYSDDDVLEEIYEEQNYYANTPARYKSIKTKILYASITLSCIVILIALIRIYYFKRKYPSYNSKLPKTFRDIPSDLDPKLAAALVACREKKPEDDGDVYSALLLSLVRKKYLEIDDKGGSDPVIIIKEQQEPKIVAKPKRKQFDFDPVNDYSEPETNNGLSRFKFDPIKEDELSDVINNKEYNDYIENDYIEEEKLEPLTTCEEHYLKLIKHHAIGNRILMSAFRFRVQTDYNYTENFNKNIQKSVVDNGIGLGYFQKANWLEPKKKLAASTKSYFAFGIISAIVNIVTYNTQIDIAFGAFILFSIVCILTGIYVKCQSNKFVLLTEFGEKEYAKWRGLYNFLKSDTLIKEKTYIELPLWEKYLVYATAFGISEKVIEAIKIRCPSEINSDTTSIVHNSYCRSGHIHSSGRSFRHSVYHGSSGGYHGGGGFGYGGGGRGGGGGGGGH